MSRDINSYTTLCARVDGKNSVSGRSLKIEIIFNGKHTYTATNYITNSVLDTTFRTSEDEC